VKERCDRFARLNAEPIAKCAAQMIDFFSQFGVHTEKLTCVGFSLGAHICGLIANFVTTKMERIVGMNDR